MFINYSFVKYLKKHGRVRASPSLTPAPPKLLNRRTLLLPTVQSFPPLASGELSFQTGYSSFPP
jgi:hypothetical protein